MLSVWECYTYLFGVRDVDDVLLEAVHRGGWGVAPARGDGIGFLFVSEVGDRLGCFFGKTRAREFVGSSIRVTHLGMT